MEACMRTVRRANRRLGAASERFQGFQGEFELGETELSGLIREWAEHIRAFSLSQ